MSDVPLCVYCRRRPVESAWRPFCGERCKMADLGRWLSGDYRVPVRAHEDDTPEDAPEGSEESDA
jgi:endogenous inhibitor of DNA gyrase (YacG/DUF329 family)